MSNYGYRIYIIGSGAADVSATAMFAEYAPDGRYSGLATQEIAQDAAVRSVLRTLYHGGIGCRIRVIVDCDGVPVSTLDEDAAWVAVAP